jgi:hypothetical protein
MKLGISLHMNLMKNMSNNEGVGKANPKLRMKLP